LIETIDIEGASVAVDARGVVLVTITEANLERSNIHDIDTAVWALAGDVPPDVIIDARRCMSASARARKRATEGRGYNRLAVIVAGPVSVVVAGFFMRVAKLPHPSRSFRSVEEAHAWLIAMREVRPG
jgi:hypothetical protein